jgi:hypothetical protein
MHGSGSFDEADLINSEQKTTGSPYSDYYWIYDDTLTKKVKINGVNRTVAAGWTVKKPSGANSVISMTKQNEVTQGPTSFAYGTGWYASHPVSYNSLFKDKTLAKSYQEANMMHHQVEYARGFKGDISVDMNCTGPTAKANGKGSIVMRLEDDVLEGTVHVSELQTDTLFNAKKDYVTVKGAKKYTQGMKRQGWKEPLIEVDANYVGSFHIKKTMQMEISKSKSTSTEDWLPCCSGGFFDIWSYDMTNGGQIGIFDCTCRNTSISSFKPKWNASLAQFPTEDYVYKP